MVSNMDLFESGIDNMSIGGYLICENCNGYYQLQEGESPSEFDLCECGGHLNYQETHNFISKKKNGTDTTQLEEDQLDYEEIQEMVINLKNKAEKRKKQFEELSKKVEIQEEILNEIKDGKLPMWGKNPNKNIKSVFIQPKNPRNNISGNSDIYPFDEKDLKETMEKEEKKLMARIQEKRTSVRNQKSSSNSFKENISLLKVASVIAIILLILAISLYFFK
ncbi:MAG: hypothetical protein Q7V10_03510 [Methanobacteriaceae archaeon]|jgi:hypothetical protein|nr:hypothetical protein [Methanobacteriaceae archaeon]MDO9626280.1 hypothetical protein [Methanobacteriaceae archaeon]